MVNNQPALHTVRYLIPSNSQYDEEEKKGGNAANNFPPNSPILSQYEESASKTGESDEALRIMQSSDFQNRTTLSLLQ